MIIIISSCSRHELEGFVQHPPNAYVGVKLKHPVNCVLRVLHKSREGKAHQFTAHLQLASNLLD